MSGRVGGMVRTDEGRDGDVPDAMSLMRMAGGSRREQVRCPGGVDADRLAGYQVPVPWPTPASWRADPRRALDRGPRPVGHAGDGFGGYVEGRTIRQQVRSSGQGTWSRPTRAPRTRLSPSLEKAPENRRDRTELDCCSWNLTPITTLHGGPRGSGVSDHSLTGRGTPLTWADSVLRSAGSRLVRRPDHLIPRVYPYRPLRVSVAARLASTVSVAKSEDPWGRESSGCGVGGG